LTNSFRLFSILAEHKGESEHESIVQTRANSRQVITGQLQALGKVELSEEEQVLVKRYRFDEAVLIAVVQPNLLRQAIFIGFGAFVVVTMILSKFASGGTAAMLGLLAGSGAAYWWINEKRETIVVRDLMHGRHFTCDSVIELAKKEAFLTTVTSFLRQVMESAKHWDGTQSHVIEPLPKDEARQVIMRGV
jgi:hypothetical protein